MPREGRRPGFSPGSKYDDRFRDDKGNIDYDYLSKRRKKEIDAARKNAIRTDEKKRYTFKYGKRVDYLICPICHGWTPHIVRTDARGQPVDESPGLGKVYVEMPDGSLERRFSGPGDDYFPVMARFSGGQRIGTFANPDESLRPLALQAKDHQLFTDFKKIIRKASQAFEVTSY